MSLSAGNEPSAVQDGKFKYFQQHCPALPITYLAVVAVYTTHMFTPVSLCAESRDLYPTDIGLQPTAEPKVQLWMLGRGPARSVQEDAEANKRSGLGRS